MEQDQEPALAPEPPAMAQLWAESLRALEESRKHPIIAPPPALNSSGEGTTQINARDSGVQVTPSSSKHASQRNSCGLELSLNQDAAVQQVRRLGKEVEQMSSTSSALIMPSSDSSSSSNPGSPSVPERNAVEDSAQRLGASLQTTAPRIVAAERRGETLANALVYNYLANLDIESCREASTASGSTTGVQALNKKDEHKVQIYRTEYDGSGHYNAGTSISGTLQSPESALSGKSLDDDTWDLPTLLNLTNVMRVAICRVKFSTKQLMTVSAILRKMLVDESSEDLRVSLDLIVFTRFEKLIAELLEEGKSSEPKDDLRIEILAMAASLQHKWFLRFKDEIFQIDKLRMAKLQDCGDLHGVQLTKGERKDKQKWTVKNEAKKTPEIEGEQMFKNGDWWINMVCAYRDGIVSDPMNPMTKNTYGTVALALLSGKEEDGPEAGSYYYIKEGSEREMNKLLGLTLNRGRPIRILRGYMLKSKYAPEAGVRYDGLYKATGYTRLPHDEADGKQYVCRITLERFISDAEMQEVLQIPTPSQLDDWALYNRIIGQDIRQRNGDVKYSDWRSWQDQVDQLRDDAPDVKLVQDRLKEFSVDLSAGDKLDGARGGHRTNILETE